MVRPVMRDILFLRQKSEEATVKDLETGRDLQDTLRANQEICTTSLIRVAAA